LPFKNNRPGGEQFRRHAQACFGTDTGSPPFIRQNRPALPSRVLRQPGGRKGGEYGLLFSTLDERRVRSDFHPESEQSR